MLVLDYENIAGRIADVKQKAENCEIRVLPKGEYEQLQRDSAKLWKFRKCLEDDNK